MHEPLYTILLHMTTYALFASAHVDKGSAQLHVAKACWIHSQCSVSTKAKKHGNCAVGVPLKKDNILRTYILTIASCIWVTNLWNAFCCRWVHQQWAQRCCALSACADEYTNIVLHVACEACKQKATAAFQAVRRKLARQNCGMFHASRYLSCSTLRANPPQCASVEQAQLVAASIVHILPDGALSIEYDNLKMLALLVVCSKSSCQHGTRWPQWGSSSISWAINLKIQGQFLRDMLKQSSSIA